MMSHLMSSAVLTRPTQLRSVPPYPGTMLQTRPAPHEDIVPGGLNELTWFTVVGYVYDVEQPNPGTGVIQPLLGVVSAYVDFFPGYAESPFPAGFTAFVKDMDHGDGTHGDTMLPLAPITARLLNNQLCSIVVGNPPGVELVAGTDILNLEYPLFYHVRFRNVTYGGGNQAISNFAFLAPTFNTIVSLTSPDLIRYEYGGPR